jgi:hypothetical protein
MAVTDVILRLREKIGYDLLWLPERHVRCLADALRDGAGTGPGPTASDTA